VGRRAAGAARGAAKGGEGGKKRRRVEEEEEEEGQKGQNRRATKTHSDNSYIDLSAVTATHTNKRTHSAHITTNTNTQYSVKMDVCFVY
jgi:hypothetical protein